MIPASYLYKDLYLRNWGDPGKQHAEPVDEAPRGPRKGHLAGLAALFAAFLPLEMERGRRVAWHA